MNVLRSYPKNVHSIRETWILDGPTWKFPVWVKVDNQHQSEVELSLGAGVHLLDCQRRAATGLLDTVAQPKGTRWIIGRQLLSSIARRTVKKPEDCVYWAPSTDGVEEYGTLRFGRKEADDFCLTFFQSYQCLRLQNVSEVVYFFNAFCKHIFDWLLNKQRPVDLIFCSIFPRPYRSNWKALGPDLNWLDPKLMAYLPDKDLVQWGLEILPSAVWDKHVMKLEEQRRIEKGDLYWRSVMDFLKRQAPEMAKVYERFKVETFLAVPPISKEWDTKRRLSLPGSGPLLEGALNADSLSTVPKVKRAKGRPTVVAKKD